MKNEYRPGWHYSNWVAVFVDENGVITEAKRKNSAGEWEPAPVGHSTKETTEKFFNMSQKGEKND